MCLALGWCRNSVFNVSSLCSCSISVMIILRWKDVICLSEDRPNVKAPGDDLAAIYFGSTQMKTPRAKSPGYLRSVPISFTEAYPPSLMLRGTGRGIRLSFIHGLKPVVSAEANKITAPKERPRPSCRQFLFADRNELSGSWERASLKPSERPRSRQTGCNRKSRNASAVIPKIGRESCRERE